MAQASFFTKSISGKETRVPSDWNSGKIGPKKRKSKGHKSKTGKAALTKTTHHYGKLSKG